MLNKLWDTFFKYLIFMFSLSLGGFCKATFLTNAFMDCEYQLYYLMKISSDCKVGQKESKSDSKDTARYGVSDNHRYRKVKKSEKKVQHHFHTSGRKDLG